MKKALLSIVAATAALSANAWEYPYLTFVDANGKATSYSVERLRVTVADGALTLTNADGTATLAPASLATMRFSATSEGTDGITKTQNDKTAKVEVFTTAGVSLGTFSSKAEAQQSLAKGVYIVKAEGKTTKMTRQ